MIIGSRMDGSDSKSPRVSCARQIRIGRPEIAVRELLRSNPSPPHRSHLTAGASPNSPSVYGGAARGSWRTIAGDNRPDATRPGTSPTIVQNVTRIKASIMKANSPVERAPTWPVDGAVPLTAFGEEFGVASTVEPTRRAHG
jgi:hypothetical protein